MASTPPNDPTKLVTPPKFEVQRLVGGLPGGLGALLATGDVDMLLQLVMMESTRLEGELVSDQLRTMSKRNM